MILAGWPLSTEAARLRCGSDLLSDLIFVCGDRGIYLGKSILIVSTLFCINILWHLRSCQWKQIFLCTSGNCKSNWKVGEIPNCTGIQPLENGKQANTRTFRYKQTMSYWSSESWAWTAALIQISALTQNKPKKVLLKNKMKKDFIFIYLSLLVCWCSSKAVFSFFFFILSFFPSVRSF